MYADLETKGVFTPAPFAFFWSARNLKNFLARSKLYPVEEIGSVKYDGERCQFCLSINKTDTLESFQTKQIYEVNYHLNCNDNCFI